MKIIQKIWIIGFLFTKQCFAEHTELISDHVNKSWCSKMMAFWEFLGTNIQLAIQLALLLIVFYALTCLFQCKKKSGCVTSCDCGCAESCTCKNQEKNNDLIK